MRGTAQRFIDIIMTFPAQFRITPAEQLIKGCNLVRPDMAAGQEEKNYRSNSGQACFRRRPDSEQPVDHNFPGNGGQLSLLRISCVSSGDVRKNLKQVTSCLP
jgi:hypothetical protein